MKDKYLQETEGNTIFVITNSKYLKDSLVVYIDGNSITSYEVLGDIYLSLNFAPTVGSEIIIEYEVKEEEEVDLNLLKRVRQLEEEVRNLTIQNQTLYEALNQKVDKHTFRVWIKAIETTLGVTITEGSPFGIDGVNAYKRKD